MSKHVLVTGVSGTGKSTLAQELPNGIDLDKVPGLYAMHYKASGEAVTEEFDSRDLDWVQGVDWRCSPEGLQALQKQQIADVVYYCGGANNIRELLSLFHRIILLRMPSKDVFRERLTHRTTNDWGQASPVQQWLWEQREGFENAVLEAGAKPVDATQPLQSVIREVMQHGGGRQ